jgi:hypothetical protein
VRQAGRSPGGEVVRLTCASGYNPMPCTKLLHWTSVLAIQSLRLGFGCLLSQVNFRYIEVDPGLSPRFPRWPRFESCFRLWLELKIFLAQSGVS